jgi:hypothetical protein
MGGGITPQPFLYPAEPHTRRHGPYGYSEYRSYRDWLRDEFSFRCVFCLYREQWSLVTGIFDLDHYVSQSKNAEGVASYENLLYVCRTCNAIKSDEDVPDPCGIGLGKCITVNADGTVTAISEEGEILIANLRLDSPDRNRFRRIIIGTIRSLDSHDRTMFTLWMSYPNDLPDLTRLKPKGNTRPEGVYHSFHARRARGALTETY